jgi:phosphoribosyl 1,2-cyclic phosphodiesterase
MMQFAALGSGSEGNGTVIRVQPGMPQGGPTTAVMLDCGFGLRECMARLDAVGLAPTELAAVLVTHEHTDHASGALSATREQAPGVDTRVVCSHTPFAIGALQIVPFPVPHDAREPVQFTFSDGVRKLGILTDIGCATAHVIQVLGGCDVLVLECNHDTAMLASSAYPPSLKARIRGNFGHLSNDAAAAILAALNKERLARVFGAHLSKQNNTAQLARAALARALGVAQQDEKITILAQDAPSAWFAV